MKDHKRLLQATICQKSWKPGGNGQILRKVQPSKPEPWRSRSYEPANHSTEIKTVIKNLPKKQNPRARYLHRKFYQAFREELMPILLKLFRKIADEGTLPNSFYKATITLIPKSDKNITKKRERERKLQANISNEHRYENHQQNSSKQNSTAH